MAKKREVPGNAMAEAAEQQRFMLSVGQGWLRFVDALYRLEGHGIDVYRMTLKGDLSEGVNVLVVLCAYAETGKVVAFHNVDDIRSIWRGLAARIDNGSLAWKEDQYG